MLTDDSTAPAAKAASTDSVGSTHSDPRTYSLSSFSQRTTTHHARLRDPVSARTPAAQRIRFCGMAGRR